MRVLRARNLSFTSPGPILQNLWFGEYCSYTASINLDYISIYNATKWNNIGLWISHKRSPRTLVKKKLFHHLPKENVFLFPFQGSCPPRVSALLGSRISSSFPSQAGPRLSLLSSRTLKSPTSRAYT